ncbi:MAG TPA: hypothetical protein VD836_06515 [Solirubrobacteraceae bacterium]|nr:hypothetical protein [Solirubrobacteraceae bacterium]
MNSPITAILGTAGRAARPLAVLLLFAALAAPSARAGSYVVVGCADLAGALGPAHTVRPAEGWYVAAGVYPSRDDCAAGGAGRGLFATGERVPNLFRFDAPPATSIAGLVTTYRAHLSGAAAWAVPTFVVEAGHDGGWEYIRPAAGHLGAGPVELAAERAYGDARGAQALRIGVRCELAGPCVEGGEPSARFHALAVILSDEHAPAVGVTAPLGHVRGSVDVAVSAQDAGGGVFERTLDVDGRRLAAERLCATVPASLGAERHVTARVPCPRDTPATISFDSRDLADGFHTLVARVEDVAGNARSAAERIVVDNLPPQAGTLTLSGDASEALTAQASGFSGEDVTYDYRWERCDDTACAPIGGAVSRTYRIRPADAGQRLRAVVEATDGGGTVRVASARSGLVPRSAAPLSGDSGSTPPRARLTAWLERGRRRLRRTTVSWPARVRIRGRLTDLRGRPLARTSVRMRERIGGRWRAVTGVRTRRDGRLTTFTRIGPSRRLRLAYRGATVTLRLRVRAAVRVRIRTAGRLTLVSGRVLGGRVPRAGLRVRLQSRGTTGWRTRALLRTDGVGRFSASGRAPAGARLRVVVPSQPGYPYARGVSRPQ